MTAGRERITSVAQLCANLDQFWEVGTDFKSIRADDTIEEHTVKNALPPGFPLPRGRRSWWSRLPDLAFGSWAWLVLPIAILLWQLQSVLFHGVRVSSVTTPLGICITVIGLFFAGPPIDFVGVRASMPPSRFRNEEHILVDMLLLRPRYPKIFLTMADKVAQYDLFRTRQNIAADDLFKLIPRFEDPSSNEFPERCISKPRWGAYGEDVALLNREDILSLSKERRDFMIYEEFLLNHADLRKAFGEEHTLVTMRVWTIRFLWGQRDVRACLLASKDMVSNSLRNKAIPVRGGGVYADLRGLQRRVPLYDQCIEASQWCADQLAMLPMIGWDWAITDKGVYLMEGNLLCTHSRYLPVMGSMYTVAEVDAFLLSLHAS